MNTTALPDGPLEFRGLRDWPNVRFDDRGAEAAGRDGTADGPGDTSSWRSET